MGLSLISYKAEKWRGRTTLSVSDRGERRMVRIKNGLISNDGSEIRMFPGWRCLLDFSPENNPNGYERYVWDAVKPIYTPDVAITTPQYLYRSYPDWVSTPVFSLKARAKPIHFHFFEQIDDRIFIGGETRFREVPMVDTPGVPFLSVARVGMVVSGTDQRLQLTMSGAVGGYGSGGISGEHYLHGLEAEDICFIDGLVATGIGDVSGEEASAIQAYLDANVNGRVHRVAQVSGNNIRFYGDRFELATQESWEASAGEVHRIRPNYDSYYGDTPQGITPYYGDEFAAIDDPDALTSWRVQPELPLSIENCCSHKVYPAQVANRQRDFSDLPAGVIEGVQPSALEGTKVGLSRREQRRLPYRMVPEPAGDRIIIAVPGYHCLFQIPLMQPSNPMDWPSSPSIDNLGIRWFENDVYDRPRALGLPKPRLIDSAWTPAPSTPSDDLVDGNSFIVGCFANFEAVDFTWPEGTYRMCVSYYDEVTNEEGPPSEIIEFTVPAPETPSHSFVVRMAYFHPGYVMPECLAFKLRVYLSDQGGEALGLYKTMPLFGPHTRSWLGMRSSAGVEEWDSAKYGFASGFTPGHLSSPTSSVEEWQMTYLPIPLDSPYPDLASRIDFTKPPLESNSMPRGASAARYIRGNLISVGHAGVGNASIRTWPGLGSIEFDITNASHDSEREILIRIHDSDDGLLPGEASSGLHGFGLASRFFPDAYQGISIDGARLLFGNKGTSAQIEKVVNRLAFRLHAPNLNDVADWRADRLRTYESIVDPDAQYSSGLTDPEPVPISYGAHANREFFYRLFKGQIQIGDPGAPWRVSKSGGRTIQFLDPNRDDDGVAVFQFAGNAVICTRKETSFLSWSRSPAGEYPTTISSDFGCIAPNSGAEFDGGLVWISERGPVALGASLQFVGMDIEEDFAGDSQRYLTDSTGMMRHAWACHDNVRGQVYFGLITVDATHTVPYQMGEVAVTEADDETLSRAACNEILCWSYRNSAWTTWQPPEGLEVLWMRPIRVATGVGNSVTTRIAMLNADGRVRVLDDAWQDDNASALTTTATAKGSSATSMTLSDTDWGIDGNGGADAREGGTILRVGQRVEAIDSDGNILWATTLASADPDADTIELSDAQSWLKDQTIRIGIRQPMEIETTFVGSESPMNLDVAAVQMRFTLHGSGKANVDCTLLKSDLDTGTVEKSVSIRHRLIGEATASSRHSRRRQLHGRATAPEVALRLVVSSEPQVRIADLALEV